MAQTSQVSGIAVPVELTCSADKFYGMFRKNISQLVQMYPETLKSYRFVQGNDFGNGAVVMWNFNLGTPSSAKVRHDTNDATKTITFTALCEDKKQVARSQMECKGEQQSGQTAQAAAVRRIPDEEAAS